MRGWQSLAQRWNDFWFSPVSALPLCLFRVIFGSLVLQYLFQFIGPDLNMWFGPHRLISIESSMLSVDGPRVDLLLLMPDTNLVISTVYGIIVAAAILFTGGLFYRLSSCVLFVGLLSLHHHAPLYCNASDNFLRIVSLLMMLAPAAQMVSLDCLIAKRKNSSEPGCPRTIRPWAQRLIQIQVCAAYFQSFLSKSTGEQWWTGEAIYNVTHLDVLTRLPIGWLTDNLTVCQLLGWYVLLTEFALFSLIWIPSYRRYVIIAGIFLHLGIELTLVAPMFEWLFISSYLLFLDPKALEREWKLVVARVKSATNQRRLLFKG